MDHLWSTRCIPLHAATATESDKKTNKQTNKKGMPVTEHLVHVFDSEINIFQKFQVKIKF